MAGGAPGLLAELRGRKLGGLEGPVLLTEAERDRWGP